MKRKKNCLTCRFEIKNYTKVLMKTKAIFVVILLPFLLTLTACSNRDDSRNANFRSYTPRDSSYTISFPKEWDARRGRRSFQLMLISPREDSSDTFQENVIVFREDTEGKNLEDYVEHIVNKKLPETLKDFKVVSRTDTTVNGEKAIRLEYEFSYRSPAKSVSYVFEKDGFAYVVLGTAPDSAYARYSGIFDKVASTFKFTKK